MQSRAGSQRTIDRFVCFNRPENRARVRGKRAVIAVPYEEEGPETAELLLAFFFEKSPAHLEMDLVGRVLAPGVGPRGAILEQEEVLAQAHDLGRGLARQSLSLPSLVA
jgi:hypothetical protein